MKAIQNFKVAIIATMALISTVSCSNDDEKDNDISTYPANAKGVCVYWGDNFIDTDDSYYLWINDYIVKYTAREDNIDINQREERNIAYYPLTMNVVYELLSDFYGTEVADNTDFSELSPIPQTLIQYIQTNKSKYKYIIPYHSDYILFNKTSDKNY